MNISVYLFGNFKEGYSQYPDDYAKEIFTAFAGNAKAVTQIAVHRDGGLMYYGYIRKLEGKAYVGLCAVINGKYITQLKRLFGVFERAIETMVQNGCLIRYDGKGALCSPVGQLYENREEIASVTASLQAAFEALEGTSRELPPVRYGVSKDAVRSFTAEDSKQEMVKSSCTSGFTYIYKDKGYDTAKMSGYKEAIERKNKEIEDLRKENAELKKKKRNKIWTWVFILLVVVTGVLLACVIEDISDAKVVDKLKVPFNKRADTTVTDVEGNVYNTVQIGNQCWMKENLRTTKYSDGTEIALGSDTSTTTAYRYNPNNNAGNVDTYGYLYNWKAVMGNSSSSSDNPSGVQGICPEGWHVPSDAEWDELTDYVSKHRKYRCGKNRDDDIAKALASTTGWDSSTNSCAIGNNPSANNATGFSAFPAGTYYGSYNLFGSYARFWSATEGNSYGAYYRYLFYDNATVNSSNSYKYNGRSVRCLRN